ncbi:MAG: radical SAM protein [Deltaproteobacteria bacterium]|nr:radical SAM protein [Deltaproteobacteria bacterium]
MNDRPAIRYLVLWVTGACNLNCRYCYRGETNRLGPLSFDAARAALAMVASFGKPFHVQLTGGEPCMEPVLVEKIAAWIRKSGLNASIGLQTNGTLLDKAITRIFRKYKIEIGLSIDGIELLHNAHRAAFRQTLRGLITLAEAELPCRVTTVVTRQNASQLDRLALMLAGFENVRGVALDLLVHKGNALHHTRFGKRARRGSRPWT